jgi:hypothetical protein
MHVVACVIMALMTAISSSASAQPTEKWVTSWTGSIQGPYPIGNPSAQPDLRFAFPSAESGGIAMARKTAGRDVGVRVRSFNGEAEVTKNRRAADRVRRRTEGAKETGVGSHSRVVIDVAKLARQQRLARSRLAGA